MSTDQRTAERRQIRCDSQDHQQGAPRLQTREADDPCFVIDQAQLDAIPGLVYQHLLARSQA